MQEGRIKVVYKPTVKMLADGMSKLYESHVHRNFIQVLGVRKGTTTLALMTGGH